VVAWVRDAPSAARSWHCCRDSFMTRQWKEGIADSVPALDGGKQRLSSDENAVELFTKRMQMSSRTNAPRCCSCAEMTGRGHHCVGWHTSSQFRLMMSPRFWARKTTAQLMSINISLVHVLRVRQQAHKAHRRDWHHKGELMRRDCALATALQSAVARRGGDERTMWGFHVLAQKARSGQLRTKQKTKKKHREPLSTWTGEVVVCGGVMACGGGLYAGGSGSLSRVSPARTVLCHRSHQSNPQIRDNKCGRATRLLDTRLDTRETTKTQTFYVCFLDNMKLIEHEHNFYQCDAEHARARHGRLGS
jgi:hypothetical protein